MDYIDKIIASDDRAKMEELRKIYKETLDYIKATDLQKYREIECSLYEIVEGKRLNEEKALKWVSEMNPSAKWTMEDTTRVKEEMRVDIPSVDFYVLMNMLYSDFGKSVGDDVETYVKLARDWYYDEDTKKDGGEKLYCYWKMMKE